MLGRIPEYPMGFDHGNSETCGYIIGRGGIPWKKKIPSMLSTGSMKDIMNKRSSRGATYDKAKDALKSDEIVITYEGIEYLVGDLAMRESLQAGSATGDVGRYASTRALVMLMGLAVQMLQETEFALHITTGLPVDLFNNENRAAVKQALESGDEPHIFHYNGATRRMHVTVAKVVMEGIGPLITYGEDESTSLQGVIDIGWNTTDLIVARGIKPVSTMCKGKTIGVENIGEILSNHFSVYYGRVLRSDEIRELLLAYSARKTLPQLVASGKKVDMDQVYAWIEASINDVAQDILSFVRTAWKTRDGNMAGDILPLFVCGGGPYYFMDIIKNRISHAERHTESEFDNVEGYAHLAHVSQLDRQHQEQHTA